MQETLQDSHVIPANLQLPQKNDSGVTDKKQRIFRSLQNADKNFFTFEDADDEMLIFEHSDKKFLYLNMLIKNCLYLKMLIKIVSRRARRRHYWLRRSQR